ncbi:MAG: response regulator [Mariprofundus sp.]|nr:response regulator [Mariprofundus sp.]
MIINKKILFIDDEQNILQGYNRSLHGLYDIHLATDPEQGLKTLVEKGPFAAVVADYTMPIMNGIELLKKAQELAPQTVRLILTGYGNMENAIQAINEGSIFRFLTKPCDHELLVRSLDHALEQYRLIMAEKEIMEQTVLGSVRVMSHILSLVNPEAFKRTYRIKYYMNYLATELALTDLWQFEIAATLCQLGCITLPAETLQKFYANEVLTEQEREFIKQHPKIGYELLMKIPRLETIASMVNRQHLRFADLGCDNDKLPKNSAEVGGCMLAAVLGFDRASSQMSICKALEMMRSRTGQYHPLMLHALETVKKPAEGDMYAIRLLYVSQLEVFMVADEEIKTKSNLLLLVVGQELNNIVLKRLHSFASSVGIQEPVRMRVPIMMI